MYIENKGYLCNECPKVEITDPLIEMPCKFKVKGCRFSSVNSFLLKKHEIYLCRTGYKCPICKTEIKERLILHHTKEHCTLLIPKIGGNVTTFSYHFTGDEMYYAIYVIFYN